MTTERSEPQKRRGSAPWLILGGGVIVGLVMAFLTIGLGGSSKSALSGLVGSAGLATPVAELAVGQAAPPISAQTLSGETISLADLRGKVVAINFWATWCAPCRVEMPALQEAYERHKDEGFTVLAVNAGEPVEVVRDFVDELGLRFPVLLDPDQVVVESYRVRGFPTTVWVDAESVVRAQHIGLLTEELIEEYINQLMGGIND